MPIFRKTRIFVDMKRWIILVVLCQVSLFQVRAQSVDWNLIEAVQQYSSGNYNQAQSLLQSLSTAAPGDDAVWYYLAMTSVKLGKVDEAQSALEQAVKLDSGNFWYRTMLARLYVAQGKIQEGQAQYERMVKAFPDKEDPTYELLDLYLKQQEFDKALSALDEIQQRRGPSEAVVRTRHDVLASMGRQEEAIRELEQFAQEYASPSVQSILGDYYLNEYQDSLAGVHYGEALALDSSFAPAVLGMSEVYRHKRQYGAYFNTLTPFFSSEEVPVGTKSMYIGNLTRSLDPKILQLHREGFDSLVVLATTHHPSDSTLLTTAGQYYYVTGRIPQAGTYFQKAADAYPQSIGLTATYIQFLNLQEDWPQMRDRSLEAFGRFKEVGFMDYANLANYQLRDFDAIIGNCREVIARYPKDKTICLGAWSMMGDAWHSKGNSREAYKAYEKALRLDSSYAPVLNNYAYYLSLEGKKLKKAYTMSKKTVEAEPDNATYLDTFAWILHLQGKDLEAKPFFKHAMLYGGKDSAVMLDHYAEVLYALGEYETAKLYWRQAKAKNTGGEVPDLEERVQLRLQAIEGK